MAEKREEMMKENVSALYAAAMASADGIPFEDRPAEERAEIEAAIARKRTSWAKIHSEFDAQWPLRYDARDFGVKITCESCGTEVNSRIYDYEHAAMECQNCGWHRGLSEYEASETKSYSRRAEKTEQ